jgi:ribose transport system substrate-binding protein
VKSKKLYGAALAAVVMTLAACGSSGSSNSGSPSSASSGSGSSAAVAPTGDASSAASNPAVAAAEAAVTKATTFPTAIPVTDALPSKPPTGKTVVFLQCEQEECGHEGEGMKAATDAIGWHLKVLNFKAADPATLVTALKTALQYKPVGVFFSGVPPVVWQSEGKAYAAANAFITENFNDTVPSGPGIEAGRGYGDDSTRIGTLLADAQIADSQGAPANALFVNVPDYTVFVPTGKAYHAEMSKTCPSCQITDVNITLPQLLGGQLIPAVVSAAKRAKDVKYIVAVNGSFVAQLPPALKAAGLDGKFKIISGQGVSVDQKNVLNGDQLATVNSPLTMGGWQDVDMAVRKVMNLPIPAGDHIVPIALLTKDNIGTPEDSYDIPADYAAQFKKLWQVGS